MLSRSNPSRALPRTALSNRVLQSCTCGMLCPLAPHQPLLYWISCCLERNPNRHTPGINIRSTFFLRSASMTLRTSQPGAGLPPGWESRAQSLHSRPWAGESAIFTRNRALDPQLRSTAADSAAMMSSGSSPPPCTVSCLTCRTHSEWRVWWTRQGRQLANSAAAMSAGQRPASTCAVFEHLWRDATGTTAQSCPSILALLIAYFFDLQPPCTDIVCSVPSTTAPPSRHGLPVQRLHSLLQIVVINNIHSERLSKASFEYCTDAAAYMPCMMRAAPARFRGRCLQIKQLPRCLHQHCMWCGCTCCQ